MAVNTIFGIGWGTFFVIVGIALGVVVMIFGLAFPNPGLFVFIGLLIPTVIFVFVIACPKEGEKKEVQSWENDSKNYYIIARWAHFIVMLAFLGFLIVPFIIKWGISVIPQRVDSSSHKDFYDDRYLELIEKQKKKKYNLEESDALLPKGLSLNKKKFQRNISNNQNSNNLIQNNSQSNISNNMIDNSIPENNNENPISILPRTIKKNEFNENKKKFKGFKRKKDNQ